MTESTEPKQVSVLTAFTLWLFCGGLVSLIAWSWYPVAVFPVLGLLVVAHDRWLTWRDRRRSERQRYED